MTDDHLQGKLECLHYKYLTEGDWTPGHSLHLQKLGTSPTVRLSRRHHSYPHWSLLGWNDHFHSKICKFPRNDFLEKKKGDVKILQTNLFIPPTFHVDPILTSIHFRFFFHFFPHWFHLLQRIFVFCVFIFSTKYTWEWANDSQKDKAALSWTISNYGHLQCKYQFKMVRWTCPNFISKEKKNRKSKPRKWYCVSSWASTLRILHFDRRAYWRKQ